MGDLTDLLDVLTVCNLGSHLREGPHLVAFPGVVVVLLVRTLEMIHNGSEWEFATEVVARGLVQLQSELRKFDDGPLRKWCEF